MSGGALRAEGWGWASCLPPGAEVFPEAGEQGDGESGVLGPRMPAVASGRHPSLPWVNIPECKEVHFLSRRLVAWPGFQSVTDYLACTFHPHLQPAFPEGA